MSNLHIRNEPRVFGFQNTHGTEKNIKESVKNGKRKTVTDDPYLKIKS